MLQAVENSYVYMVALSFFILIVCLLTGFYLKIENLKAIGIIYGLMLLTPLFMSSKTEMDRNILLGVMIGLPSLIGIAIISSFITRNLQVMGVLRITEWSETEAAKYPLTIHLGSLALTLGVTPAFLLSVLVNIPGPVAEESFFRVFLINLLTPIMGKWKTLIAQAIGFGVIHWLAYGLEISGMITAALCGLSLGILYTYTGSETSVSLSHIMYNIITIILAGGV